MFAIRIETLAAGEHLIAVRAYDSANNAGVARVLRHFACRTTQA